MQRNAQRRAAPARGQWIGVRNRPAGCNSSPRIKPIPRPGQQRAQLFEGQPQSQGRGQRIGRCAQRQPLPARIQKCKPHARQCSGRGQQRMVNHGQRQHPLRVTAQVAQIDGYQKKPLRQKGREQRQDTEVPYLSGIQARNARRALGQNQRQQHAQRRHRAIGRDKDGADVEENGMHLSQHTAF